MVAAACVPVVVAVAARHWSAAFGWLLVAVTVWALATVPVRGRPAVYWLADLAMFTTGVMMGWSLWQARAAAGRPVEPGTADLPGCWPGSGSTTAHRCRINGCA